MSLSREMVLKARYRQFRRFGFSSPESTALAKSACTFASPELRNRILRRNRRVRAILESSKAISLDEAVRLAAMEDSLLESVVEKELESKSMIVRLLKRLR